MQPSDKRPRGPKRLSLDQQRALEHLARQARPKRAAPLDPANVRAPQPSLPKGEPPGAPWDPCQSLSQNAKPFNRTHQTWSSWPIIDIATTTGGWLFTPKLFLPTDPYEIASAIQEAEAAGKSIRALGSGWSFSDAVLPQDSPIPLIEDILFKTAHIVVPDLENHFGYAIDMTRCASSLQTLLPRIVPNVDTAERLFFVEAGITLGDLNLMLDHQKPRVALKTLGGSSGQTLAGAISTSTHGGDFDQPPLADSVRAIYLIGGRGLHHWIEPSRRITSIDALRTAFPCLSAETIHYDDDMFRAALVSMGAMGVIYAVLIDVVPQYSLVSWNQWTTWEALKGGAGAGFAGAFDGSWSGINDFVVANFPTQTFGNLPNRFLQVVINPIKNDDGTHNCYVTNRVRLPLQLVPSGETPADPSKLATNDLVGAIQSSPDFGAGSALAFFLGNLGGSFAGATLIDQAKALIEFCKRYGYFWAIRAVIDLIFQKAIPMPDPALNLPMLPPEVIKLIRAHPSPGPQIDLGYKVMTGGVFGGKLPVTSVEAAFDFPDATMFVDLMLGAFDSGIAINSWAAGYLSLRVCGATSALMGIERFTRTGTTELSLLDTADDEGWVSGLEMGALGQGIPFVPVPLPMPFSGILHWGQSNGLMTADDVKARFPDLDKWRAIRAQLGGSTFVMSGFG